MIYSDGSAIEKSAKMWELDLPPISLPTILQTTLSRKLASPKLESFVELQNTSKMFGEQLAIATVYKRSRSKPVVPGEAGTLSLKGSNPLGV